ncbi:MAG: nucleotidyltransferase family protein [Actinomycetota bacterium]|nr:nucleotidyltransferase family protein [Actinomycetota bacterium]
MTTGAVTTGAVAVVLAAGAGRRFAGTEHKLLAGWGGRPLLAWALDHACAAGLDQTWVVTGAVDFEAAGVVPAGVRILVNPRWAEGQATSVQAAIEAATAMPEIDALVIGLGDQPLVPASAWRSVAQSRGRPIAVATYRGRWRNPVRIDRPCWPFLASAGDEGARMLMRDRPELVMTVACDGDPADVDTVEDLAALGP